MVWTVIENPFRVIVELTNYLCTCVRSFVHPSRYILFYPACVRSSFVLAWAVQEGRMDTVQDRIQQCEITNDSEVTLSGHFIQILRDVYGHVISDNDSLWVYCSGS